MHVLVIGINYWPEQTGIGVFTTGRCEYLAARGHRVTVCTSFPYYPDWRTMDGYRGRLSEKSLRNGVDVRRTWIYVPRRVTSLRRILHEGSFVAASFASAVLKSRPDVIFTVSPPLGLAASALILSRRWNVPYVFHVADLQPDAAVDLGMLRSKSIIAMLYGLEGRAYRNAALVTTLTEAMRGKIAGKGIPDGKVALVSDWSETDLFNIPLSGGGERFQREYKIGDRFIVSHSGNMGVKQGLDVVLGAAEMARGKHPELLFLLVGDGAMKPRLQENARKRGLENVVFIPILPPGLFHEMLAASDLCLITQQASVADIVFPSKVLTLLSAGRPVVASLSHGSEIARVLKEADAGIRSEAEDPGALMRVILRLQAQPELRAAMGANGRTYARMHWEKGRALRTLEDLLLKLAHGEAAAASASAAMDLDVSEPTELGLGND